MTEEEAKTKDCCGPDDCGEHIYETLDDGRVQDTGQRFCAGSQCMAWRWSDEYKLAADGSMFSASAKEDQIKKGPLTLVQPGYCGIAGQP